MTISKMYGTAVGLLYSLKPTILLQQKIEK